MLSIRYNGNIDLYWKMESGIRGIFKHHVENGKKLDGVILFVLLLLMIMSVVAVYSGTRFDPKLDSHHVKTIYFYMAGFIAVIGIGLINYKLYVKYALLLYGIGILFLILANVLGSKVNNANGWLKISESISFQ